MGGWDVCGKQISGTQNPDICAPLHTQPKPLSATPSRQGECAFKIYWRKDNAQWQVLSLT
jgi:hypothetical protein